MSPWERALGREAQGLDPGLRSYCGTIPLGSVGRGEGVFDVVGTPRRWLWPVLSVLALDGIVFPVWEHAVPFTVTNQPTTRGTVQARRVFHFESGDATMTDEIGITASGLTDRLGEHGLVSSTLVPSVVGGRLVLRSTGVTLRLGPVRVPLGVLSPRVTLVERTEGERQHVSLRLSFPVIGTIYEYAGSFSYRVEKETGV
ncbi:hypothetical protein BH11ACT5_BH11ACT5_00280 [soil metagenome]